MKEMKIGDAKAGDSFDEWVNGQHIGVFTIIKATEKRIYYNWGGDKTYYISRTALKNRIDKGLLTPVPSLTTH